MHHLQLGKGMQEYKEEKKQNHECQHGVKSIDIGDAFKSWMIWTCWDKLCCTNLMCHTLFQNVHHKDIYFVGLNVLMNGSVIHFHLINALNISCRV